MDIVRATVNPAVAVVVANNQIANKAFFLIGNRSIAVYIRCVLSVEAAARAPTNNNVIYYRVGTIETACPPGTVVIPVAIDLNVSETEPGGHPAICCNWITIAGQDREVL
ncbi:hypothetical protein D3C87_1810960 [compost metagenome]